MRSDNVTKGVERAPNRSLFYALGYTKEELERPLIGVVCSYNEIVPGHMNLDKIAEAVKAGVRAAGGTPVEFPAIAVCDGIAMGHIGMKYSLVTRDLIADSTEAMAIAHQFDGLVMIPNCDKNVPGLLMAAARVNVPTIFCSGGPMLAGRLEDGRRSCLSHMFEAVGAYKAGKLDEAGVEDYENNACPTCGSCSGMYTANSMNCLTEAIGMGLRGNGTIPAVWSARLRLAKHAGMQIMELVAKNIRPRDIMTPAAFHNAETVDMALGCSTNTMLHLPAIAHECGIELDLDLSNEISSKTPNLCHLAPAGDTYMEDLEGAGGVYAVMKELTKKGLLDTSVLTCTGKTLAENLEGVVNRNPELIRPIENPYSADGGIAVLKGNLAPEGCVVKRSAVAPEMMLHTGPARVFNSEEEAIEAIYAGKIVPGDVWSSATRGPRADPGCGRCSTPPPPLRAWVWIRTWPSSPTAASPAPPAGPPSATSAPRPPRAAPSAWWRRGTSFPSTSPPAKSSSRWTRPPWPPGVPSGSVPNPRSRPAIWPGMQNWSPPPPGAPFWNNQKLPRGQTPRELLIIVPECCCRRGSGSRLGRCSPGRRGSHGSPSRRSWPPCRSCRG